MIDFLKKYFTLIVLILLIIGGLKSCADSRKIDKIFKEITIIKKEFQSIKDSTYTKDELNI
jgi:TM2 domain-containing membrane protein YozV